MSGATGSSARARHWRATARLAGWLVALIALVWVLAPIARGAGDLAGRVAAASLAQAVAGAAAAYGLLAIALLAVPWWWLTGVYGARGPAGAAIAVWARTQLAKYLPGNVGHLLGRQLLAERLGQRQVVVAAASALETAALLATAAAIALAGLAGGLVLPEGGPGGGPPGGALLAPGLLLLAITAAFAAWPLVDAAMRRLPGLRDRLGDLPRLTGRGLVRNLAPAMALYGLFFATAGTIVWALVAAGWPGPGAGVGWGRAVWATTIAWLAGTVVIGAPGGLGVREATLAWLLGGGLPPADAATAALAFRLVTLAGDLVAAGIGWLVRPGGGRRGELMGRRPAIVEDGVVAGNVYDKYRTANPVARVLMRGFLRSVEELVRQSGAREIHEVGCGEGELSLALARRGASVRGSDFSTRVIERARAAARDAGLEIPFQVASVYDLEPETDAAELVVCCEVLEHLERPRRALEVLSRLAAPHLLVSVPREPLWRILNLARLRYVGALGNTPGHLQHWSKAAFLRLLGERFEIVAVRAPLPWTMALCRRREARS